MGSWRFFPWNAVNYIGVGFRVAYLVSGCEAIAFHSSNAELQAAGAGVLRLLCSGHKCLCCIQGIGVCWRCCFFGLLSFALEEVLSVVFCLFGMVVVVVIVLGRTSLFVVVV